MQALVALLDLGESRLTLPAAARGQLDVDLPAVEHGVMQA
jgi:hypothetical protein